VYEAYNQVYSLDAQNLCDYVGDDECSYAGSYQFSISPYLYSKNGGSSQFSPVVKMAFSTTADGGSDLGGANIHCSGDIFSWKELKPEGIGAFVRDYGLLTMVILSVAGTIFFLAYRARQTKTRIKEVWVGPAREDEATGMPRIQLEDDGYYQHTA